MGLRVYFDMLFFSLVSNYLINTKEKVINLIVWIH